MNMTESEAREKWCPHVRMIYGAGEKFTSPCNRVATIDIPNTTRIPKVAYCIASDCMMWQWNQKPEEARTKELPSGDKVMIQAHVGNGYCGLIQN